MEEAINKEDNPKSPSRKEEQKLVEHMGQEPCECQESSGRQLLAPRTRWRRSLGESAAGRGCSKGPSPVAPLLPPLGRGCWARRARQGGSSVFRSDQEGRAAHRGTPNLADSKGVKDPTGSPGNQVPVSGMQTSEHRNLRYRWVLWQNLHESLQAWHKGAPHFGCLLAGSGSCCTSVNLVAERCVQK